MLTDDWLLFVENDTGFPDGHFEQLLFEGNNLNNPLPLVRSFTGALRYCERLKTLTEDWKSQGVYFGADLQKRLSESRMLELVREYCRVLFKVGEHYGTTDGIENLKSAQIRFEPDHEVFSALTDPSAKTPWSQLTDDLNDFYIDKIFSKSKGDKLSSLDDATLQLTKWMEVTMWVMEPLVETGLDLRPGYEIITGGGRMAVLDHEIVCHIQNS